MEVLDAIMTRRSIRKFKEGAIPDKTVELLLAAAMSAPSAGNAQPWQFIVIDDRRVLDAIPTIHPYAGMVKEAPLAVLVCGDLSCEKYKGFWVQDCSAAVQNLLLAAHGLGLGAVWTGFYPMEERVTGMRKLLGLPEHVIPLALVPLGHPDQPSGRQDRFRKDRIHRNGW
ncbi:MAG: nitroreductase family protein [Syntrophobacteraceae bacterium]|jgi:nitroreductase|nr:nitroreductase family protein [Syntrophobacteraceae bacterium]